MQDRDWVSLHLTASLPRQAFELEAQGCAIPHTEQPQPHTIFDLERQDPPAPMPRQRPHGVSSQWVTAVEEAKKSIGCRGLLCNLQSAAISENGWEERV